jgi:hypothetical protein
MSRNQNKECLASKTIKVVIGAIMVLVTTQCVYIVLQEFPQCDFARVIDRSYLDGK